MNNFPAITEAQRQELIVDCEEEIAYLKEAMRGKFPMYSDEVYRSKVERQQIALAALTAEKRLTVSVVQKNERLKGFNFEGYDSLPAGEHEFYTTPPAPVLRVPDGWKLVPSALTAENGAKAALLGEFNIEYNLQCHECFGEGCDDCDGEGRWVKSIPVDWTTIKAIWAKGVEHFQEVPPEASNEQ